MFINIAFGECLVIDANNLYIMHTDRHKEFIETKSLYRQRVYIGKEKEQKKAKVREGPKEVRVKAKDQKKATIRRRTKRRPR